LSGLSLSECLGAIGGAADFVVNPDAKQPILCQVVPMLEARRFAVLVKAIGSHLGLTSTPGS
jgi:hypothetical protein